jgi:hypothetical protein
MIASYTPGDAVWTIVVFLLWITFFGLGIWLLIRLFRNTNFLSEDRVMRIVVKVILVVFTIFAPMLGVLILLAIWYFTRSPREPDVPPRSAPEDTRRV